MIIFTSSTKNVRVLNRTSKQEMNNYSFKVLMKLVACLKSSICLCHDLPAVSFNSYSLRFQFELLPVHATDALAKGKS